MTGKPNFSFSKLYRTKNRIPIQELETGKCLNCGYEFRGHFCPDCGQEVAEFNRPFGFVVYDFMGNFFAFDTRFLRTFKYLLFHPGYLTIEFFKGRRTSYSPPFRIFVFLSFVLFLLLSFLTDKGLETELDINKTVYSKINQNNIVPLNEKILLSEKPADSIPFESSLSGIVITENDSNLNIDLGGIFLEKGNMRSKLNQVGDTLETNLKHVTDPSERQRIKEYIAMCRAPETAFSSLLKYLSWAFLVLLPLFALILKLFYIRRKQLYIKHLIFSIHLHSFLFMILIPVTLLRLIFDSVPNVVNLLFFGAFPIYLLIALHNFYGQTWPKVVAKLVAIGVIYNFLLCTVVLLVFIKSLQII
jgi:hypothetical protein